MNILVTGGAGYVGTVLLPLLLKRGYKVTVLDNLIFGGEPLLPFFRERNFTFTKGDIRNAKFLKENVKDKDVIIHLAAIVGYPACRRDPDLARTTNVLGSKNIADAVSKNQLVLFASTGSNYGVMDKGVEVCIEDVPLKPISIYGKTKAKAEKLLMEETSCTAFRFATAFGVSPRLRTDLLINDFAYQAMKEHYIVVFEAEYMRTFIHVYDMARVFLFAIDNSKRMTGEIYNVGSEKMNYSKKDICELIKKQIDAYIHYADVGEDVDKRNYIVSYKKLNSLGYKTTISVEQGIHELVKAYQAIEIRNTYSNV